MASTSMHTRTQTKPARRTALALLAAVAVTLTAVAAPLAGTAHAGGRGGIGGDCGWGASRPPLTQPQ